MNSPLHLNICVKSAGHRTVSGCSLTTPYGARPGIGRCYHIRRRPTPVRYVTTQEKILKNRPVPGRLSNSPVMCKSMKSYDVSFICDHSIRHLSLERIYFPSCVTGGFVCRTLMTLSSGDWGPIPLMFILRGLAALPVESCIDGPTLLATRYLCLMSIWFMYSRHK